MNDVLDVSDTILLKNAFEKDEVPKKPIKEMNAEEVINHLKEAMQIKERVEK